MAENITSTVYDHL